MTHIHPALETIDLAFPAMSANNIELERTPGTTSFRDVHYGACRSHRTTQHDTRHTIRIRA
jgi:hypothetical protein